MSKDKKEPTVLEQVKKIEKIKKAQVLAATMREIKEMAKSVLLLKEETNLIMEEIGISTADAKKVVDYVNSLVELTESDKKDLKEKVKERHQEKEQKVEEEMEKRPASDIYTMYASAAASPQSWDNAVMSATSTTADWTGDMSDSALKMSLGDEEIKIQ